MHARIRSPGVWKKERDLNLQKLSVLQLYICVSVCPLHAVARPTHEVGNGEFRGSDPDQTREHLRFHKAFC